MTESQDSSGFDEFLYREIKPTTGGCYTTRGVTAALAARVDAKGLTDDSHTSGTGAEGYEIVARECTLPGLHRC
ncbi:hypothetical protein Tco_1253196 [Tanacetum coccineum]